MADTTTIEVTNENWSELNALKESPGTSMNDVVDELLAVRAEVEEKGIELDCLTDDEASAEAIAEQHRTFVDVADSVDESAESAPADAPGEPLGPAQAERLAAALDDLSESWRRGDSDERVADRIDAARAAVEYLAEQGGAGKSEVIENVESDHSVDGQAPRTWYRKNVRPVFNEVAEYDNSRREYVTDF
jgi:predicted CopG family antitoxin